MQTQPTCSQKQAAESTRIEPERNDMTTAPEDQSEREALRELVALRDIKDKYANAAPDSPRHPQWKEYLRDIDGYFERERAAWQHARAALRAPKVEAMQLDARWYTVSTERAMRTAFNVKHPFGDEVPGALREAFFELFKQGWSAALSHPLPALAPLQVDNKPQG